MMPKVTLLILLCEMFPVVILSDNASTQAGNMWDTQVIQSKFYTWTLSSVNLPYTRCITQIEASDITKGPLICDRRYNDEEIAEITDIWEKDRHNIGNLELSCAVQNHHFTEIDQKDNSHRVYNQCVCVNTGATSNQSTWSNISDHGSIQSDHNISILTGSQQHPDSVSDLQFRFCNYPNILTTNMFRNLTKLRILKLYGLAIEYIEPGAFTNFHSTLEFLDIQNVALLEQGIPKGLLCQMTNLRILVMLNFSASYEQFPSEMFSCPQSDESYSNNSASGLSLLTAIFANGNKYKSLPPHMFGATAGSLVVANLTANEIQNVHPLAFNGLENLTELNLAFNQLSFLHGSTFNSLKSLIYLDLQGNLLEYIETSIFSLLPSVQQLVLSKNNINSIEGTFGVLANLKLLHLDKNKLQEINGTTFQRSYYLQKLYLDDNKIDFIDPDAFKSMVFLRSLELRKNNIFNSSNIQSALHRNLERLGYIGLSGNYLTYLPNNMFQTRPYLHSLEIVDLSFNQIAQIEEHAFMDMNSMYLLSLNQNKLKEIKANTFRHLQKLLFLWIDFNELSILESDWLPANVGHLSLMNNNLNSLPKSTESYGNLQQIYISYNNITHLNQSDFTNFPNLKLLNITHNQLSSIKEKTFENLKDLEALDLSNNYLKLDFTVDYWGNIYRLYYLNLSHNAIESAENLFMHHIRYINYLDLSYNPLHKFPNQPKEYPFGSTTMDLIVAVGNLYLKNCSLSTIHPEAFDNMPNLVLLDLSKNLLKEFDPLKIKTQDDELYFVYLYDNPIHCSCQMQWLRKPPYSIIYKLSECILETTTGNEMAVFDQVRTQQFLCKEDLHCLVDPNHCDCYTDNSTSRIISYLTCSDRGLIKIPPNIPQSTLWLHIESNHIQELSFMHVEQTMETLELYLDHNQISHLSKANFKKFTKLELLTLNNNRLRVLTGNIFSGLYRLQSLQLHNNLIQIIEPIIFEGIMGLEYLTLNSNDLNFLDNHTMLTVSHLPYLTTLTLHDNPWECQCDNLTFKEFLQVMEPILRDLSQITCNDTAVITIPDDNFLCYDTKVYV